MASCKPASSCSTARSCCGSTSDLDDRRAANTARGPVAGRADDLSEDGSALVSPVWFRWQDGAFEVVIAKGDLKLRHLAADPQCALVVFESVRPFCGVEVRGEPELVDCDVTAARVAIASRYLGIDDSERFAAERASKPGVLLRLVADNPRAWDLSGILPSQPA